MKGKSGRPPAGVRAGECVKDYPQHNMRLPEETVKKLTALSVMTGKPKWRLVIDLINHRVGSLSETEKNLFDKIVTRRIEEKKRETAKH